MHFVRHMKSWRLNQSRSKVDQKSRRDGREERPSRSKLKQAFVIDSDAELFMCLISEKFDV